MTTTWRRALALGIGLLASLGCDAGPVTDEPAQDTALRARASVEPPEIRIGERAVLEIVVASPPDRRLLPFATPESPTGFEVLAVEVLPVEERSVGWLHRTRVQLRARDVGSFAWPQMNLELVDANGATTTVSLPHLPLRVRSILPAYPGRSEPFGARGAPKRTDAEPWPVGIAIGAAFSLILLGLAALTLRRRRRRALPEHTPLGEPAWTEALRTLGLAGPGAEPADAANAMVATLHRYMLRRFGAAQKALTSEELADVTPPFAATSRWPTFVSLLRDLDALRFGPRGHAESRTTDSARIEALRDRARAFVADSTPPEALQ
jgi:MYXO-CTERM domain-containing protein